MNKLNLDKKINHNSKKCALFLALSSFALLNTGFTAQPTSTLPVANNSAQVEKAAETIPSEGMKVLIEQESKNVPSKITVSNNGSLSASENDEQKQLLAEVVNNTMANIQNVEEMQGLKEGEAVEEPEFTAINTLNGVPAEYSSVMDMEATAYLPTDGSAEGLTATGIPATYGIVAVDPSVIPLGTRVYIPGYGEALAADVGGAIQGYKIDLCMETYEECMNFGRRNITVYVK